MKPLTTLEEARKNREEFTKLLADGEITQKTAATLITEQTNRSCSVRTVRSWLNDEESVNWRPCPRWAVVALETRLMTLKMNKQ